MVSKYLLILLSVNAMFDSDTNILKKVDLDEKSPIPWIPYIIYTAKCSGIILQWTWKRSGRTCVLWTIISMEHLAVKDTAHNFQHPHHQLTMGSHLWLVIILLYKNAIGQTRKQYIVACQRSGVSNEPPQQRQDTGPGILWSVHRWTRTTGGPPRQKF